MGPPFTSADSFVAKAEKDRNHLRFQTAGIIAKPPPRERPQPLVRTLVIRQVEINRLADIDIIRQRFNVEFVVHLAFEGGALDVELSKSSADFPLDGWGRPTFRPSASWYMAQVDFNNAHEYKTLDAKVLTEGDDLILTLRFEGCFSEVMELEHFPCDVQDLTMSLAFNCRTTGMMPLRLAASPDLKSSISKDGFVDGKMWTLHPELEVSHTRTRRHRHSRPQPPTAAHSRPTNRAHSRPQPPHQPRRGSHANRRTTATPAIHRHTDRTTLRRALLQVRPGETGTSADRMFPSLQMVLLVGRNPLFYFWNIALPVCLFVPMAALQFTVQRDYSAERLGVSLAIVLTAIAHKYSMTTLVPSVSYLTFLYAPHPYQAMRMAAAHDVDGASLPHSLTPSLPPSLTPLPPSLTRSLAPSLLSSPSLARSLPLSLLSSRPLPFCDPRPLCMCHTLPPSPRAPLAATSTCSCRSSSSSSSHSRAASSEPSRYSTVARRQSTIPRT